MSICCVVIGACRPQAAPSTVNLIEQSTVEPEPPTAPASAGQLFAQGNFDDASKAIQRLLIESPDDPETTLLAAKIEAARSNPQLAIELISSIDVASPLAQQAAELRYSQSLLLRDARTAHESLEQLRSLDPDNRVWVDELWMLLNRDGRRQEACDIADRLCQSGIANDAQMLSLVRRTESFPFQLAEGTDPTSVFFSGLGISRWYFTQQDYRHALEEFESNSVSNTTSSAASPDTSTSTGDTVAAQAFYGRLLAETQAYERIGKWHETCDEQVQEYGDYWAALGLMFVDQAQHEAAARALLEAVYRNPTDRYSFQRLARVFDALGRTEDAAQFRHFGIQIAESERIAESLQRQPRNIEGRKAMSESLLELYRPFEMLQWTASTIPPAAIAQRNLIASQRQRLSLDSRATSMAAKASQMEIDRETFPIDEAIHDVLGEFEKQTQLSQAAPQPSLLGMPRLVNVAAAVGANFQWYHDAEIDLRSIPISESVGGGIAVIDYDLDGWPDLYFAQGSGQPPNKQCTRSNQLRRNIDGVYQDATQSSASSDFNYSSGLAVGDVNQDGFADIFIGNLGRNRLLVNNGDGTFTDASDRLGDHVDTFTTSLAIADIDHDRLPDLFECNYIEMEGAFALPELGPDGHEVQPSPLKHFPQPDRWFRSRGDGQFESSFIDESVAKPATSLGVIVTDFNGDHRNEIFVGNDVRANHFLTQSGDGSFRNVADALGCANGFNGAATGCMGIATGDFNHDGQVDLHVANFADESANLYLQNSSGSFVDAAVRYRVSEVSLPYVAFGTKAIDIDRNGWIDLLVTNGHIFDMRFTGEAFQMPPQCLMSMGDHFDQVDVDDPSQYWQGEYLGRAMTLIDFDRDGALDVLVGHLDAETALLHNETKTAGDWFQIELVGCESERDAIGAKISVQTSRETLTQWVTAGDGYFSSDEAVIDFGIGLASELIEVKIDWPSGHLSSYSKPTVDRRYLAIENESKLLDRTAERSR